MDNTERAKKFYEELFEWKIEAVTGMKYYLIQTADSNGKQGVGSGIAKREKPEQKITNFIGVSSIEKYIDKVEKLGGKLIEPKTPIPGWGFLAVCLDTEDNTFGLWEEDKSAKMQKKAKFTLY